MKLARRTSESESPSRAMTDPFRVFEEFFRDWSSLSPAFEGAGYRPATDIYEKDGNLIVKAEVPGIGEKDIELKLEGNVLTLRGERKREDEDHGENYHRRESVYGVFSRSFTLPETVDRDKIEANFKNGVLTITIPQKPEVKPRAIPVKIH